MDKSDALSDPCSNLQEEKARLQKDIKEKRGIKKRMAELADQCYVSGYYIVRVSSIGYSYV
jgi:hypothetical protein